MFVAGAGFYVDSNNGQLALVTTGASWLLPRLTGRILIALNYQASTSSPLSTAQAQAQCRSRIQPKSTPCKCARSGWLGRYVAPVLHRLCSPAFVDTPSYTQTAVTWLFNFINALVFPLQIRQWTSFGGASPLSDRPRPPSPADAASHSFRLVRRVEPRPLVPRAHVLPGDQGLRASPFSRYFARLPSLSLSSPRLPSLQFNVSPADFVVSTQTLEELDDVFSMSTARQARYGLQSPAYWFRRYILRQKVHRVGLQHFHPSEEKDKAEVQHRELV